MLPEIMLNTSSSVSKSKKIRELTPRRHQVSMGPFKMTETLNIALFEGNCRALSTFPFVPSAL